MVGSVIGGFLAIAAGLYLGLRRNRYHKESWKSDVVTDFADCHVRLIGGPWGEKTVKINGLPELSASVMPDIRGLGSSVKEGHYVVIAVEKSARRATASWTLYI